MARTRIGRKGSGRLVAGLLTGLWLLAGTTRVTATRPSFSEALNFGYALQQDYAVRRSEAIIERLDRDGMKRRVFSLFKAEAANSPLLQEIWEKQIFAPLLQELRSSDTMNVLVASRVLRIDGVRTMDCLLLDTNGSFRMMMLYLHETPDGDVKIQDVRFLGDSLEFTRRMRQMFLLLGASSEGELDPEERDVEAMSKGQHVVIGAALRAMAEKQYRAAFQAWQTLPDNLQATRIWQEFRNNLVLEGSKGALVQLEAEAARGGATNAFIDYARARLAKDGPRSIAALDRVIAENRQPAFLRMLKADLLLNSGQPDAALALAKEIYERHPRSAGSYFVAVKAAARTDKPAEAMRAIRQWGMLIPGAEVDQQLEGDPTLAKLRASPDYLAWKQSLNENAPARQIMGRPPNGQ